MGIFGFIKNLVNQGASSSRTSPGNPAILNDVRYQKAKDEWNEAGEIWIASVKAREPEEKIAITRHIYDEKYKALLNVKEEIGLELSETSMTNTTNKIPFKCYAVIKVNVNLDFSADEILTIKVNNGSLSIKSHIISFSLISGEISTLKDLSKKEIYGTLNGMIFEKNDKSFELVCCLESDPAIIKKYIIEAINTKQEATLEKAKKEAEERRRQVEKERIEKERKIHFLMYEKDRQLRRYGKRYARCWKCHASLSTETHRVHYTCKWLECSCGACGCNYPG